MRQLFRRRAAAALVTAGCLGAGTLATAVAGPAAADERPRHDVTSPAEARRVDRVRLSPIAFKRCAFLEPTDPARCAFVKVPLDYDRPNGAKVTLNVVRVRATNPAKRIGVLFLNPGGPSGSAAGLAAVAPSFLDPRLLERFDVVGVDPRGVGLGDPLECFRSTAAADAARAGRTVPFPVGRAQENAWIASARAVAKGCGTTGRPLSASASTAEVARDMDVVRRALGDRKLTFLGFSYGTQLGQVYANMFPDRVRALALDGVIDPVAWTTGYGSSGRRRPVDYRLRSDLGSYRALSEFFARCDKVAAPTCSFAGDEPSLDRFRALAAAVKKRPVTVDVPDLGPTELGYADLVSLSLDVLYSMSDPRVPGLLADVYSSADAAVHAPATASPARRAALARAAGVRYATLRDAVRATRAAADPEPYDSTEDVFSTVLCSDGDNPRDPRVWRRAAAAADRRAPFFGRLWTWQSTQCASSIWTARDEDRYVGPFTRRTAAPLLFVGNYYDPATPYLDGAVPAAKLAPNSRLLTSDSWGHTAYGTSACVTDAVAAYLLRGALPRKGAVCVGDQPFEAAATPLGARGAAPAARPAPIRPALPDPFVG